MTDEEKWTERVKWIAKIILMPGSYFVIDDKVCVALESECVREWLAEDADRINQGKD